ncbi:iron ABC transporter permease [Paenibacillus sp. J5C_2022]|uniref:FecCD family ABC transporter permease n=1 Tax=Paenibacillus sp. J5C2022 TaxID=2977129 RepID=UPI0021D00978|nr:iron ABC transporter permease [Paenibacillus sp. J5C2022]MCU6710703.1 iron ABC transporter permease [Paenibacillus sp. J5C2022]
MPLLKRTSAKWCGLAAGMAVLLLAFTASIAFGQTSMPLSTVWTAFFSYDPESAEHVIVTTTRLSRAIIALVIGASLAISGALMQALTRNPLASPSLFGINAGATLFVVLAITFFSVNSLSHYMWFSLLGGTVAAVMVFALGSLGKGGASPLKFVLAGAAVTALLLSLTQGFLVISAPAIQGALFWLAGSVAGRTLEMLLPILPFLLAGWAAALFMGKSVNILTAGDEVATGLGQRTFLLKAAMAVIIVVLAGGSVSVGGSIGFIGLIVPHIVRSLVGADYRWIIPYCVLVGGIVLLLADIGARFMISPEELPIGVMTALVGTPFFIYLARKGVNR